MATYTTRVQLKSVLKIATAQTTFDHQVDEAREEAYDWINSKLRDYVTPPLTGDSEDYNQIVRAEKFIAAGYFRMEQDEPPTEDAPTKGQMLEKKGKELVEEYIKEHYLKSKSDQSKVRKVVHTQSSPFWEA